MANSLLDFVISVVRDPGAAAAYAADPAQAIADAHLTDVTNVDVDNLIPVVAESLSSVVPTGGTTGVDGLGDAAHNVWASGAATAAFDAFGDHLPLPGPDVVAADAPVVADVIDQPEHATTLVGNVIDDGGGWSDTAAAAPAAIVDAPMFDHVPDVEVAAMDDAIDVGHHATHDARDDHLDHPQDPGFDIFT